MREFCSASLDCSSASRSNNSVDSSTVWLRRRTHPAIAWSADNRDMPLIFDAFPPSAARFENVTTHKLEALRCPLSRRFAQRCLSGRVYLRRLRLANSASISSSLSLVAIRAPAKRDRQSIAVPTSEVDSCLPQSCCARLAARRAVDKNVQAVTSRIQHPYRRQLLATFPLADEHARTTSQIGGSQGFG